MEAQNHSITKRTAHHTGTQYLHCTYSTEAQLNQSSYWTRAPSPQLWISRSTTLEKEPLHRDAIQKHKATKYKTTTIVEDTRCLVIFEACCCVVLVQPFPGPHSELILVI